MAIGIDVKGIGEGVGSLFTGIGSLVQTIKGGVSPDKQAELLQQAQALEAQAQATQADINKIEASSASIFVAGWRPAVGWICALGLLYGTIGKPILELIVRVFGYQGDLPVIDSATLQTTLWGMLGLGTMRTVEKIQGASQNH